MPTVLVDGPYSFVFFSSDKGEPPHIHVKREPWYPRLFYASASERQHFRLLGDDYAIEWPDLDEHIGIEGLLAGRHSGESQKSLKRWLESWQVHSGSVPSPS